MDDLATLSLYDVWMWWINAPFWISIPAPFIVCLVAYGVVWVVVDAYVRSLPD